MNKIHYIITISFCFFTTSAFAAEYECIVDKKTYGGINSSKQQIKQEGSMVKIVDKLEGAFLFRCSYSPSEQKNTCDKYSVDKIVYDKYVKIKKFYVFNSQFDVQLFPNMTFIENNGRGGVAYGKCDITSP